MLECVEGEAGGGMRVHDFGVVPEARRLLSGLLAAPISGQCDKDCRIGSGQIDGAQSCLVQRVEPGPSPRFLQCLGHQHQEVHRIGAGEGRQGLAWRRTGLQSRLFRDFVLAPLFFRCQSFTQVA